MTVDRNIAEVWDINNAPTMSSNLAKEFLSINNMTRFAKSKTTNDSRIFTVDRGVLYHLSPNQAANLGLKTTQSLMSVNPEIITTPITTWSAIVVKDAANKAYVIDGGIKRPFVNINTQNQWTNSGAIPPTRTTNGFLNLLPNGNNIDRSVKTGGPNIYAIEALSKRWIQSWNTYESSYRPHSLISESLMSLFVNGSNIP
jgi:hypothetical protein